MNNGIIIAIAGAALATYLTRFPLLIVSGKKEIPSWLVKYMGYIAPAVLTALIVPSIFVKQGRVDFTISNKYMIAAVVTSIVAYFSKNMLATVITGMCCVGLLMYLI